MSVGYDHRPQAGLLTVHLVNLTNPMLMKGPYRELILVFAPRVTIQLPEGMRVVHVQLLVSGQLPGKKYGWIHFCQSTDDSGS